MIPTGFRIRCRHGLSDEEKKNAGDDFKLHLELWRIRVNMIAAVLILIFFTGRRQVPRTSGCYKYYYY